MRRKNSGKGTIARYLPKPESRNLWEKNFPWEPTYDPDVKVTQELVSDETDDMKRAWNHFYLETFFESELRFSPQFEQIYRIMEKHDRTENPLALAGILEVLTDYHKVLMEFRKTGSLNLNELMRKSNAPRICAKNNRRSSRALHLGRASGIQKRSPSRIN